MTFPAATRVLVAALFCYCGYAHAAQDDPAHVWLERMSTAMSQMTYQGTFVYIRDDEVETMRITHVVDDSGVRERLVSVSGPPSEVLRDSKGVRWVLAENQSVFTDYGFNRSFFPELPFDRDDQAENSYHFKLGRTDRIAGHPAFNLKVLPRDRYRYGYSLWLETHSGLLLKWQLIDGDGQSLATLMFTDVRMGSEVDKKELKSGSPLKKYRTVESPLPDGRNSAQTAPRWQPGEVPSGFRLTAHRYNQEKDAEMFEHLVYSDGLAAVSVYIESDTGDESGHTGLRRHGTTHAFSRIIDSMKITVVGDVPSVTVQAIANTVAPVSP